MIEVKISDSEIVLFDPISKLVRTQEGAILGFGFQRLDDSVDIELFIKDNESIN